MGKKHIWYDEIVAWAAGEEIQVSSKDKSGTWSSWVNMRQPSWFADECIKYRIKPKKKEISFKCRFFVYKTRNSYNLGFTMPGCKFNPEEDSPSFVKWIDEDFKEIKTEVEQ